MPQTSKKRQAPQYNPYVFSPPKYLMTTQKTTAITHVCIQCNRTLPEKQFLRMPTAAAILRKHERLLLKGLDVSASDVLEYTPQEREAAARAARDWRRDNPGRSNDDNPHVLCNYRAIGGRKEVGNTCLDCRPQAPFAGDLRTRVGRAHALHSGALAPTVLESRRHIEQYLAKHCKPRAPMGTAVVRNNAVAELLSCVSAELRSVRSKIYYVRKSPDRNEDRLWYALNAYRGFVREAARFLQQDMGSLPALVWQAVHRRGTGVLSDEWVLPTIALACAPIAVGKPSAALRAKPTAGVMPDKALTLHRRLREAVLAYDRYMETGPFYPAKLPYLALRSTQDVGIRGIASLVQQSLREEGPSHDNESAPDSVKKYDRVLDVEDGVYKKVVAQGITRNGVPRLRKLLELEKDRVFLLKAFLQESTGKPTSVRPEGYTEFDD